jgi:hypothetical protein
MKEKADGNPALKPNVAPNPWSIMSGGRSPGRRFGIATGRHLDRKKQYIVPISVTCSRP